MMRRDDRVAVAVDQEERDRRDRCHRGSGRIVVVDGVVRQPLQRPGDEEVGHLLFSYLTIVGERAVGDYRADVAAVLAVRYVVDGEGAAQALAEDDDAVRIDVGPLDK